jgi:hypothetical protein
MPATTKKPSAAKVVPEEHTMTDDELREAVAQMLQREKEAKVRLELEKKQEAEAAAARKKQEAEAATNRMARSIEVIKYCVISISSVMAIALVITVVVLMEVEREAERIKREVEVIEAEAQRIYDRLTHPFQALGESFDRKLQESLGLAPSYAPRPSRSAAADERD